MEYEAYSQGSLKEYIIGFTLSVILTLAAYYLVVEKILSGTTLITTIIILGLIQSGVQLICFLHLAEEKKPRLNLFIFLCTVVVLAILVGGSLWIMFSLNKFTMPDMPIHMDEPLKILQHQEM